ncbi:MAG: caspase family protein, partial [Thermoguttaceae bacterium]|nr:caspase family protein [Thermoguttaceae bacterium]
MSIRLLSGTRSRCALAAMAVVAATCCLCVAALAQEVVSAPRMALLVGVQHYPNLDSSRQLAGARNDIAIVRSLLIDRFGFRAQDIVTLIDHEATADAIRGQWRALAERVGDLPDAGIAHIVFYFSGHGSQILDQPEGDADCDEEDGLDETLVPYDAESEGGDRDLRDDELYRFVESLCGNGQARFWGVLDCCHSGSGARGTTKIRKLDRQLAPSPILAGSRMVRPKVLPPAAVLLTACRASEVEPEYEHGGQSYGLLTRFLVQTLSEHPGASDVSYRALRESVINCYQREAIVPAPTPQLEGLPAALAETVLGVGENPGQQPWWTVKPLPEDRGTARLSAGELHGATVGSVYELYERPAASGAPADQGAAQPLAWLEVTKAEPTQATVRVFQWADSQQRRQ